MSSEQPTSQHDREQKRIIASVSVGKTGAVEPESEQGTRHEVTDMARRCCSGGLAISVNARRGGSLEAQPGDTTQQHSRSFAVWATNHQSAQPRHEA
ncbi:MAG TPA: hypothetical protein VIV60_09975 [Polyangiaceae bacterium]